MNDKPLRTHYDNIKVARDAPAEVIRAAYKTLSQKYHPDRNPGNADCARIMKIINASYQVLADPRLRGEHDDWIARQERSSESPPRSESSKTKSTEDKPATVTRERVAPGKMARQFASHIYKNARGYIVAVFLGFIVFEAATEKLAPPSPPPPGPKPYTYAPPIDTPTVKTVFPDLPKYTRPLTDPLGDRWPNGATLLRGYPTRNVDGHSKVSIDNSQGDADVFAKLVSLSGPKAYPVRTFFVPAHSSFTLSKVTPGSYDIRYRNLDTGDLIRTESFELTEQEVYDQRGQGIDYTTLSFSLYKVQDGNAQSYPLREDEF